MTDTARSSHTVFSVAEQRRLVACLYPTRVERAARWLMRRCWTLAPRERGPFDWLAARLDDWSIDHAQARADRGDHLVGRRAQGTKS